MKIKTHARMLPRKLATVLAEADRALLRIYGTLPAARRHGSVREFVRVCRAHCGRRVVPSMMYYMVWRRVPVHASIVGALCYDQFGGALIFVPMLMSSLAFHALLWRPWQVRYLHRRNALRTDLCTIDARTARSTE
jgi:hypothetical protein